MVFRFGISLGLLLLLGTQFLFLGSGLLGYCLESQAKICTCNHGSKQEKHQNAEDKLFARDLSPTHTEDEQETREKTLKPNCHSAKAGESHLCSCKKSKKEALSLRNHHQTLSMGEVMVWVRPEPIILFSFTFPFLESGAEFPLRLLRPPRT